MGLLRTVLLGRDNGFRSSIRRRFTGGKGGVGGKGAATDAAASSRQEADHQPAERALRLHPEAPKDVTPPEGYEVVLHKDALKVGHVTEIIIGGTAIAVANVGGTFRASTNSCPHADGPLGEGSLDGSVLTCPYHGWQYDLSDGTCLTNADVRLEVYEVRVVGDAVCVRI